MFLEFFSLHEQPFGVTPNPRFFYASASHREALASLVYAVELKLGFAAIVAEPGMGKTLLLRSVVNEFQGRARIAYLFDVHPTCNDLLPAILNDFELTIDSDPMLQLARLKQMLIAENAAGRLVLIVVDEAQNLTLPALESLRLLSNFETQEEKLLHIILAGQTELGKHLQSPRQLQLLQRIPIISQLRPLDKAETIEYIGHRLRIAGYFGPQLFTDEALNSIVALSGGIPRNINALCLNSLSLACALRQKVVDAAVLAEVAADRKLWLKGGEGTENRQPGGLDLQPIHGPADRPMTQAPLAVQRPPAAEPAASGAAPRMRIPTRTAGGGMTTLSAPVRATHSGWAGSIGAHTGLGGSASAAVARPVPEAVEPLRTPWAPVACASPSATPKAVQPEREAATGSVSESVLGRPSRVSSDAVAVKSNASRDMPDAGPRPGDADPFAPKPRQVAPSPAVPTEQKARPSTQAAAPAPRLSIPDAARKQVAPESTVPEPEFDESASVRKLEAALRVPRKAGLGLSILGMTELSLLIPLALWITAFLLAQYGCGFR